VPDGLDNISSSSFTLCADHSGAFADTTESLAEVAAAADEGNAKRVLLNVVGVVGWGEDFGFVDVVYANGFEDLFRHHELALTFLERQEEWRR
jgi:hypothetical protein